jgi:hypothetical protein
MSVETDGILYIKSDCQYCSGLIEFPEHGAGEMIDCPHCKRAIVLASC